MEYDRTSCPIEYVMVQSQIVLQRIGQLTVQPGRVSQIYIADYKGLALGYFLREKNSRNDARNHQSREPTVTPKKAPHICRASRFQNPFFFSRALR
jgi:hypothetical protein